MRKALSLFVALAVVAVFAACKPKPGGSCSGTRATCLDANNELLCEDGKWVQNACKGPKGCRIEGTLLHCDVTGNEGETCAKTNEGFSECTADGKKMVVCKKGKYIAEKCMGPKGCRTMGKTNRCDVSISDEGSRCEGSDYACTPDKKKVMQCKGNKWTKVKDCDGAKGCHFEGNKVYCDEEDEGPGGDEEDKSE